METEFGAGGSVGWWVVLGNETSRPRAIIKWAPKRALASHKLGAPTFCCFTAATQLSKRLRNTYNRSDEQLPSSATECWDTQISTWATPTGACGLQVSRHTRICI